MTADTQAQGDLASCPFCGGQAKIRSIIAGEQVQCQSCLAAGPVLLPDGTDEGYAEARATVAAEWTRVAAALHGRAQEGEPSDAALKEAFQEGFNSVSTYNDVRVNDSDSAWLESHTRAALAQAQKERT